MIENYRGIIGKIYPFGDSEGTEVSVGVTSKAILIEDKYWQAPGVDEAGNKYTIRWLVSHFDIHDFCTQYDAGVDWDNPDYLQPTGEDE